MLFAVGRVIGRWNPSWRPIANWVTGIVFVTYFLRILVLSIVTVVGAMGCSGGADEAGAERAVLQFHEMFNSGRYVDLFEQSAPELNKQATQDGFVALHSRMRKRSGQSAVQGPSVRPLGQDERLKESGPGIPRLVGSRSGVGRIDENDLSQRVRRASLGLPTG